MKKDVFIVLLLGVIHSILFVSFSYGINVVLFCAFFLSFLYYFFQKRNLIHNRYGLLFMIPIVLLSIYYAVYHNVFYYLNVIAIPILYILLFIYTVKPINKIELLVMKLPHFLIKPLDYIGNVWRESFDSLSEIFKVNNKSKQIVISIIVILPIVFIVLLLLSSADMIFHQWFGRFFEWFQSISYGNMIERVFRFGVFTTYLGCSLYYVYYELPKEDVKELKKFSNPYTMKFLLTVLNIIYVVFDIIQIRSLLFHMGLNHLNYADYARSGFFQLMFISIINLVILLLSKRYEETKYNKLMSVFMVLLTFIIICSSFFRMFLYEQAYGYTVLRLGVYAILITEVLLLIPTIIYIFRSDYPILNTYLIIVISIYCFINCFSVDRIITANNIGRYERVGDIDLNYLENGFYDNIGQLRDFQRQFSKDSDEWNSLDAYINHMDNANHDKFFEFNFSRYLAKEKKSL